MVILNLVLALFLSITNPVTDLASACDAKTYKDKCISSMPPSYTFLKSYTIDGKGGAKKSVEYSYIFSKNTTYLIMLANNDAQTRGITVTVSDSNKKQLANSFSKGKYYPALLYKCNATGIYFLTFTFEDTKDFCAGSVLGFKR